MDKMAKISQALGPGESLEQVERRFKHWRQTRRRGEHIPAPLWAAAVSLGRFYDLQRVAHALGIDPERLKRRLAPAGPARHAGAATAASQADAAKHDTQFVECFAAPAAGAPSPHECVVELHNVRGATMRVELSGRALHSLAGLCSAFWSAA
jgi:hypothetical protein